VRTTRSPASGFTILELMIVMVVVGILLTIAAPSMQTMIINNRISTAASDLVVDLTYARATAVHRGMRVGVCRSASLTTCDGASWQDGWMIYTDAASDGFGAGDTVLRVHEALATGLTLVPTPAAASILFRPSGPADATRTFRLCNPGFIGRDIAISATGRVSSTALGSNCP
jgi:type IV fimbrial biogenesis protein FimT